MRRAVEELRVTPEPLAPYLARDERGEWVDTFAIVPAGGPLPNGTGF